jgi:hypothetical protein
LIDFFPYRPTQVNVTLVRKSSEWPLYSLYLSRYYSCRFGNMPRNRNSKERRARRVYIHLKGNNHHWVGNTVVDDDAPTPLPTKPEAKIDSSVITTADGSQNEQKPAVFLNSDTIRSEQQEQQTILDHKVVIKSERL